VLGVRVLPGARSGASSSERTREVSSVEASESSPASSRLGRGLGLGLRARARVRVRARVRLRLRLRLRLRRAHLEQVGVGGDGFIEQLSRDAQ
jgi:hypothetical protein